MRLFWWDMYKSKKANKINKEIMYENVNNNDGEIENNHWNMTCKV